MTARRFELYPEERHFCSFADYATVLDATRRLTPARVLEFGPGWSTLALVEGGARQIDALEDDPHWLGVARERLAAHADVVRLLLYGWRDGAPVLPLDPGARYDLLVIDGPADVRRRPAVLEVALPHCSHALVALETDSGSIMADAVHEQASRSGRAVERHETGPLAGAYALIGPECLP